MNEPGGSRTVDWKTLRPALIASSRVIGEYWQFLEHLLVGLADESIPAALVCSSVRAAEAVVWPGVEVIKYPVYELPFMGHYNRRLLLEKLYEFRPTVLHGMCEKEAPLVRQLSRELNLPYVLTVNSLAKRWDQLGLSKSRLSKIIVPAGSIAQSMAKVYPLFAKRVEHINKGTFTSESAACFWEPARLPSIVTSSVTENAGEFDVLLKAIKRLVLAKYEFMLVIIGGGRSEEHLRRQITKLGLTQIVTIAPRVEPHRLVLSAGDIFVQAQPSDSFNTMLLEAMSVGTVAAACKGGVDDLIIEGKTAAVFNPKDELSIFNCLKKLLDSRESAIQLAKSAQQYLREHYTVSEMVKSTLRIYREAQHKKQQQETQNKAS